MRKFIAYDWAQTLTIYRSKSFNIPGTPKSAQMTIKAGDSWSLKFNNGVNSYGTSNYLQTGNCDWTYYIVAGNNVINITVVKNPGASNNLGGLIYRSSVKSTVKPLMNYLSKLG